MVQTAVEGTVGTQKAVGQTRVVQTRVEAKGPQEGTVGTQKAAGQTQVAQTRAGAKGRQESASQRVVQMVVRAYQTLHKFEII